MDNKPIAVDEAYEIRDNQFWYNSCKFRNLIEDKNSIKVNIEGLGTHTFLHSMKGNDGRITLSYTIPATLQQKWKDYSHQLVRVELRDVK
ncbi:hypothetical protein [Methanolobus sp.]|uniref:hypothetical protein n=1 Tax=Methanolobus sp. TaxID=1874737 RepID=UPI0025EBEBA3|nr:hypothetical protein [Methanolobus sp.]